VIVVIPLSFVWTDWKIILRAGEIQLARKTIFRTPRKIHDYSIRNENVMQEHGIHDQYQILTLAPPISFHGKNHLLRHTHFATLNDSKNEILRDHLT
jgi:hypothetical protein